MKSLQSISGLSGLPPHYRVILLDQFGTMHDGQTPYPKAAEALRLYRQKGGKVIVLSNSAKSGQHNRARLGKFGFNDEHFDAVVTSGDATQDAIRHGTVGDSFKRGACVHISGKVGDDYGFDTFGFTIVTADNADGIILAASQEPDRDWRAQVQELSAAARRGVEILVCNPDFEMLTPQGIRPSAGAIGRELSKLGAKVRFFGKPHPDIYQTALRVAGNPPLETVIAIGDSPEHDLLGAHQMGLAGVLVRGGILSESNEEEIIARLPNGDWYDMAELS